jgi:ABC-type dipeptide/oligopeptide/nickel transport system permease component
VRGHAARRAFRLRDVTSTVIVLANVVVDLLYGVLDPRARG